MPSGIYKRKSLSAEKFLILANKKHEDKYTYHNIVFNNTNDKIKIHCKLHGFFCQRISSHLIGAGCPQCAIEKRKNDIHLFIKQARKVFGKKFDYSKSIYLDAFKKIEIICPKHGSFWQRPNNHLSGFDCRKCSRERTRDKQIYLQQEIIDWANKIHKNKFDYSKMVYRGMSYKIEIICPIHGSFWQKPAEHIHQKQGCRKCANELRIGKNNPNWKGGIAYLPYSGEWTPRIKEQVKKRDHYQCQVCGIQEKLIIHHIDYNKSNCNINNLITLCSSCHGKTNGHRLFWQGFFMGKLHQTLNSHQDLLKNKIYYLKKIS